MSEFVTDEPRMHLTVYTDMIHNLNPEVHRHVIIMVRRDETVKKSLTRSEQSQLTFVTLKNQ